MEPRLSSEPSLVTRRGFLRTGALALSGLGMADVAASPRPGPRNRPIRRDTAVILLWLPGGPPHMETYDLKPDAPGRVPRRLQADPDQRARHRGLRTSAASRPHRRPFTLIRSISHNFADHGGGHKRFLTGRDPKQPTGFVNDYPMVGSMTAKMREGRNVGLPNYISGMDAGPQRRGRFQLRRGLPRAVVHAFHRRRRPECPEIRGQRTWS